MNETMRALVVVALTKVAPDAEAEIAQLSDDEEFQNALGLDSIDFLNVMIELKAATGVDVAERDYGVVRTIGGCVAYLGAHGDAADTLNEKS